LQEALVTEMKDGGKKGTNLKKSTTVVGGPPSTGLQKKLDTIFGGKSQMEKEYEKMTEKLKVQDEVSNEHEHNIIFIYIYQNF
jgi:hypothetical protein